MEIGRQNSLEINNGDISRAGLVDPESNILVVIRVRPLSQKEQNSGDNDIIRIEDNLIIVLDPIEIEFNQENKKMLDVYHRSKEQQYAFDKIFRLHSQEEVYTQTCRPLIKPIISGFNATVFAYGPTGTGKTYTMLGNEETLGLCALTIQDIFTFIRKDFENEYTVAITYVEIYNESIRDLLVPHSSYLELRDDPLKGITIAGVSESKAESTESVMNLLFLGNKRRTTEATNANLTSSRSHAVFQVTVSSSSKTKNTEQESLQGKLSLIDLAGSERGTATENRGIRLREGAKINQSLLALANCINALGDKSKKGFFVPYRDSKLTRMLKDSLGGNCKTVMIANVSPSGAQFEETINTLKYASRAKNIKTKVSANKRLVSIHISEYKNIINDLRSEIEQLKNKLHDKIGDCNDIMAYNQEEAQYLDKQHLQQASSQGTQDCVCGRQEEDGIMRKIQEEIFENFQNRIQLRRGLMEVEEQNAMNQLEIKRRFAEILVWKRGQSKENEDNANKKATTVVPEEIKQSMKAVRTLKISTEKNSIRKEMMSLSLIENIANAKTIRDSIPKKIKFQDKRNYLELVIKNHVLELQNIEMEINLQIQEKTIQDLKNIAAQQRKIIIDNQLNSNNLELDSSNTNKAPSIIGSIDNLDTEMQEIVDEGDYDDEEADKELIEEDIDDINDLQDMLEKQREQGQQQSPQNHQAQQSPHDKQRVLQSPQHFQHISQSEEPRQQKRWSIKEGALSKGEVLPGINSHRRDRSAAAAVQGSRNVPNSNLKSLANESDYGGNLGDESQSEITITNGNTPKVGPPLAAFKEKKREPMDIRKRNPNKPLVSANQRKKDLSTPPLSFQPNNQLSSQGANNPQTSIQTPLSNQNIQGIPSINKPVNKEKEQQSYGIKGKNIVLPSLNQVSQITSQNSGNIQQVNINSGGNNVQREPPSLQNRKKK